MRDGVWLALIHYPTVDRDGTVVGTQVTSLDLHDLTRLARTYGLAGVFVVTPLPAQQQLVGRLLQHWVEGAGGRVNPSRREALRHLRVVDALEDAVAEVTADSGKRPWLLGTSARRGPGSATFAVARRTWVDGGEPGLVLFGTGWGLAPQILEGCDGVLEPVDCGTDYNHLSVRSAASIVVDRLFGERCGAALPGDADAPGTDSFRQETAG